MESDPEPCRCPTEAEAIAKQCFRAGVLMHGWTYKRCAGVDTSPELSRAFRAKWDGQPATMQAVRRHLPCVHLGGQRLTEAGEAETRTCAGCRGNVELPTFTCAHPGHAADPTTTARACLACPDRQERAPPPLSAAPPAG